MEIHSPLLGWQQLELVSEIIDDGGHASASNDSVNNMTTPLSHELEMIKLTD